MEEHFTNDLALSIQGKGNGVTRLLFDRFTIDKTPFGKH